MYVLAYITCQSLVCLLVILPFHQPRPLLPLMRQFKNTNMYIFIICRIKIRSDSGVHDVWFSTTKNMQL